MFVILSRPSSAENFLTQLTCVIGGIGDEDCDPPTTPELTAPSAFVQGNDFSFMWNASTDASAVTYELCITGLAATCVNDISDTSYDASLIVPNENGDVRWKVQAKDANGNTSEWSDTRVVTLDTIDPETSLTADPLLIGGNVPTSTFTGTVSDVHLAGYTLSITDGEGAVAASYSEEVTKNSESVSYVWNVVDPTKLPSGIYTAILTATDESGRFGQTTLTIEVDNDGPGITIDNGDTIIKTGSISPVVTAEDPHSTDTITYEWTEDASNPASLDFDANAKEPTFTPLIEGSYRFQLVATDGFGNQTVGNYRFDYIQDLPPLPLPTEKDPSANTTNNPALPAVVSPSTNPSRDARSEVLDDDDSTAQVLGSTALGAGEPIIAATNAALTPTNSGWRILGILWYWWLVIIAFIAVLITILRRFIFKTSQANV